MKRRFISILLCFCLILSLIPLNAFANIENSSDILLETSFKDVSETDWFYENVNYAIENEIFVGTSQGVFSPGDKMTRSMFVTVLGRIAGIDPSNFQYEYNFSDVNAEAYYAPYVSWAVKNHITEGIGNNRFNSDGLVTREQMAVFMVRFFNALNIDIDQSNETMDLPKDLNKISHWASDSVLKLWKANILKGDENGFFNPKAKANRAEGATIGKRMHETVKNLNDNELPPDSKVIVGSKYDKKSSGGNNDSSKSSYTVSFQTYGASEIDSMDISRGSMILKLPTPHKMNFVFLGWYTDSTFTTQFTSNTAVYSNITLYAKYAELESITSEKDDRFALTNQSTTLNFILLSNIPMTQNEVLSAIILKRADNTATEDLLAELGTVENSFIITANGGFAQGAAYTLTLTNDNISFSDKDANIRICSFTIVHEESNDIPLSDKIIYIQASKLSSIIKNNENVTSLSAPLISEDDITEISGSFTYSNANTLSVGDTLCIYSGDVIPDINAESGILLDKDIAYIMVAGIDGTTVNYIQADAENVLALPDTLPIYVGEGSVVRGYESDGINFTIDTVNLDFSKYNVLGLDTRTTLDVGDYLCFYVNPEFVQITEEDFLGYAVVTDITLSNNGLTMNVTYEKVTPEEMQSGMNYYAESPVKGEMLLKNSDVARLESDLEEQVLSSGFAKDAALYLSTVAMATDGFEVTTGKVFNYASIDPNFISPLSFSDEIEINVRASIGTSTQKIGRDGLRAEVTVNFEAPMSVGDNDVVINGSATFIQELSVSVDASGSIVWDHWAFIYWIKDYRLYSYTNIYNYTGMFIDVHINSQGGSLSFDVSNEIQELLTSTDSTEIISGINELLDEYCDLLESGSEWIEIFEQNIFDKRISILFGIIQIKISGDFVVSAYINVALGTSFEYSDGTCYAFYGGIFSRNFHSYTQDLADEILNFHFYVMGQLGIRAGIRIELAVGIFNCDFNSVGFTAETGVYSMLYGYFYYDYQMRNGVSSSLSTGALYFELGIYLEINFVAQLFKGNISSSWTLYENEWPILSAGTRYNLVDFIPVDTPIIRLKHDNKSFVLPESFRIMKYLDLREASYSKRIHPLSDFDITFSNNSFTVDGDTITVVTKARDRRLISDMTITFKHGAMAFSSLPISCKYEIQWDNLDDDGYQISFEPNGGSYVPALSALYEQSISTPTNPTKIGYNFAGWYTNSALTQAYTFSIMPGNNFILYAKWLPCTDIVYTVEHYKQNVSNTASYTLADTDVLRGTTNSQVNPDVKNYEGFTSPSTQTITIAADGSMKVCYYYTRNFYTATFIAESEESGNKNTTQLFKYGENISAPSVSKAGYYNLYWNQDPSYQEIYNSRLGTMPAHDVTFYAHWKEASYNITFDSRGGTNVDSKTVTYKSKYGSLRTPKAEVGSGLIFDGWYLTFSPDTGVKTKVDADTTMTIKGAHTLYAGWRGSDNVEYTVEHYLQNADNSYTLNKISTYSERANLLVTAQSESFRGYKAIPVGHEMPNGGTVNVTSDGKAKYQYYYNRDEFSLDLYDIDHHPYLHFEYRYGDHIQKITPPVRKGYNFIGWEPAIPILMPYENLSSYAQWQKKISNITLSQEAGSDLGNQYATVEYEGTTISISPNTQRIGFKFLGWYTENGIRLIDEYGNFSPSSETDEFFYPNSNVWVYEGDIRLIGRWEEISDFHDYYDLIQTLADDSDEDIIISRTIVIPDGAVVDGKERKFINNVYEFSQLEPMFSFDGNATLKNMTIINSMEGADLTPNGHITMESVSIEGAILMLNGGGKLTDCTFTGSRMGVWTGGSTQMNNCSIIGNPDSLAGVQVSGTDLTMENCSVINSNGAGISTYESTLLMNNCTIVGNKGGGIDDYQLSSITVLNSTIARNKTYGCKIGEGTTSNFVNTIVSENFDVDNIESINFEYSDIEPVFISCLNQSNDYIFENSGESIPKLTQLPAGTWVIRLWGNSAALSGGCETYFFAENHSAAYGSESGITYIVGVSGAEPVTTYQGGGQREVGVIGAFGE